jgi:glycerophosphoryl diester phosphodiesterase
MSGDHHELRLYAHRGASAHFPENSLEAFERALADGANALELDIHRTADGHFVVAHDPDGRRMAGESEAIRAVSLERVKQWRVRGGADGVPCEVPALEEVLAAFPNVPMSIDHKPGYPGAVPDLLALLARHGAENRVTLASFSGKVMERVRSLGYRGRTALTRQEIVWLRFLPTVLARKLVAGDAAQVPTHSGPIRLDGTRFLEKCRKLGIRTDFWVVNDPTEARALLDAGATGVMTDDPARIAPVFRERTFERSAHPGKRGIAGLPDESSEGATGCSLGREPQEQRDK